MDDGGHDPDPFDMTADGFSLDDKRNTIDVNDIPDVLARWPKREDGPNTWRVLPAKIIEHDCSLAAGRYKPVTMEAVNHDKPADILRERLKLEEGGSPPRARCCWEKWLNAGP